MPHRPQTIFAFCEQSEAGPRAGALARSRRAPLLAGFCRANGPWGAALCRLCSAHELAPSRVYELPPAWRAPGRTQLLGSSDQLSRSVLLEPAAYFGPFCPGQSAGQAGIRFCVLEPIQSTQDVVEVGLGHAKLVQIVLAHAVKCQPCACEDFV